MNSTKTSTHSLLNFLFLIIFLTSLASCKKDDPVIIDPPTTSRPNILLIIADDMGLDATPGYNIGNIKPNMPRLQTLASEGIIFDNLWSAPVCSPTRATILTGKYGIRTDVLGVDDQIPLSEISIQKYLDENTNNAYAHAVIGKWHLAGDSNGNRDNPNLMGIDHFAGLLPGGVADYWDWKLITNGQVQASTEYTTTKLTDLAIDWMEDQSQAWFLWVAYNAPHTPFHLPDNTLHSQGNLPTDEASVDANPVPYYMAMIEAMDHEMGRLLDAIPEGEKDNTIVIFIGDNGTPAQVAQTPFSNQKAKGSLYQGGINVPLIVSGAGVSRSGQRETAMINTTDLYATIADIAGTGTAAIHDSKSFKSLLSASSGSIRDFAYSEQRSNKGIWTVRNEQFKLIQFKNGNQELYDLINDPYEENNLLDASLSDEAAAAKESLELKASEIRG